MLQGLVYTWIYSIPLRYGRALETKAIEVYLDSLLYEIDRRRKKGPTFVFRLNSLFDSSSFSQPFDACLLVYPASRNTCKIPTTQDYARTNIY